MLLLYTIVNSWQPPAADLGNTETMEIQTQSGGKPWTSAQAYVMAVICLLIGIAAGYLMRGSSRPAAAVAVQTQATPANVAPAVPAEATSGDTTAQVTPQQLRQMTDKQAAPLLAALQKNPQSPELLAQAGDLYFRGQQFITAADYYARSAKLKPNADVLVSLANSYHYAGTDEQAIAALNAALKLDPKSANALFNLGMLEWQAKHDPKSAIADWQLLLKTNPNHPRRAQVEEMIARAKQHMNMAAGSQSGKSPM